MSRCTALWTLTALTMTWVTAPPARAARELDAPTALQAEARPHARRDSDWHLMIEGVAEAPLFAGGRVELELPGRLRLGGFVGTMPSMSAELVAEVVEDTSRGDLKTVMGDLSRAATERSVVTRAFLSWSPFRDRGLYLTAGYSNLLLGGDLTSGEVLDRALGGSVIDPVNGVVNMSSTLHGVHGEIGYRFYARSVIIRLSLGFTGTVATQTSMTVDADFGAVEAQPFADDAARELDRFLGQYAMLPTLGLGIGYDLGF